MCIILGVYSNHTVSNASMLANTSLFACIGSSAVAIWETPLKLSNLKYCEISFFYTLILSCSIIVNFSTQHGSGTAMLCAKFQNDWANGKEVMDKWDFMRFDFQRDNTTPVFLPPSPDSRVYWGLTSKGTLVCPSQAPSPPFTAFSVQMSCSMWLMA